MRTRAVDGNPMSEGGGSACPPADDISRLQVRKCNEEICPANTTCDASQDVLFLLDGSGAAGADYEQQVQLVSAVVGRSSNKVQYGMLSYGKEVSIVSRFTNKASNLLAATGYRPKPGGSRDVTKALIVGRTLFSDPGVGQGRPRIAVLMMGGSPAVFANAKKSADELKASGVRLVIGLVDDGDSFSREQACGLASSPCSANIEAVKSFKQMSEEPGRFLAGVCRDLVYPKPPVTKIEKTIAKDIAVKATPMRRRRMPSWMKRQMRSFKRRFSRRWSRRRRR